MASKESFFGYAKIYQFNLFSGPVIENIFGLYVTVADVSAVEID